MCLENEVKNVAENFGKTDEKELEILVKKKVAAMGVAVGSSRIFRFNEGLIGGEKSVEEMEIVENLNGQTEKETFSKSVSPPQRHPTLLGIW